LQDRDVTRGIEARSTKRLHGKIVTVAADPRNADFLSLEVRRVLISGLATMLCVKAFLKPPMKTRSVAPCTYARTVPIPPAKATSTSPPSSAALATPDEGMYTRSTSKLYLRNRPDSLAIHGIEYETDSAE
jgi:hypothetical protein